MAKLVPLQLNPDLGATANLLPAILPSFQDPDERPVFASISPAARDQDERPILAITPVDPDNILARSAKETGTYNIEQDLPNQILTAGLERGAEPGSRRMASKSLDLEFPEPRTERSTTGGATHIGIIDAGIAFWNRRFGSAFKSVGLFSLAQGQITPQLSSAEIANAVAIGGTLAGDRENRALMQQRFPASVFASDDARPPLARPEVMSHGTAMADAILQTAGPDPSLHALELPRWVLRDAGGDRLRSILSPAVLKLVKMIADKDPSSGPLRIKILLAYGFPGGSQRLDLTPVEMIHLRAVLNLLYAFSRIEVEIILPMGNHLQDQSHAVLPAADEPREALRWRVLHHDHSSNTVEIFHRSAIPELAIRMPNGTEVVRPAGTTFSAIEEDGALCALIYTNPVAADLWRTTVCLFPTASRGVGVRCPAGLWEVRVRDTDRLEAWVRRDDSGFENDRAAPFRQSWFEHPAYRPRDAQGLPGLDDTLHPASHVRRAGSVSLFAAHALADVGAPNPPGYLPFRTVGAQWQGGGRIETAVYSGQPQQTGIKRPHAEHIVDSPGPFSGTRLRGNGSPRLYRVSGTSVAAAFELGRRAAAP